MLACESADREGLTGPHTDEAEVYRLAAAGDHDAQADMAGLCLAKGLDGRVSPSDAALMALMWANMASTSGKATHALAYAGAVMVQASQAMANGMPEASCEDLSGQIFFASVERFTRAFQVEESAPRVLIDMTGAHFWDISAVAALDKIVARLGREGRAVEMVGYNRASADIVDRYALHDKTGFEIGAVPH